MQRLNCKERLVQSFEIGSKKWTMKKGTWSLWEHGKGFPWCKACDVIWSQNSLSIVAGWDRKNLIWVWLTKMWPETGTCMQVMPAEFEDQWIAESGQKRLTMQLQMYDMGVDLKNFTCIELDFANIGADATQARIQIAKLLSGQIAKWQNCQSAKLWNASSLQWRLLNGDHNGLKIEQEKAENIDLKVRKLKNEVRWRWRSLAKPKRPNPKLEVGVSRILGRLLLMWRRCWSKRKEQDPIRKQNKEQKKERNPGYGPFLFRARC